MAYIIVKAGVVGGSVHYACSECGGRCSEDDKFCPSCGKDFGHMGTIVVDKDTKFNLSIMADSARLFHVGDRRFRTNSIHFDCVSVGDSVETLVFKDGSVFKRFEEPPEPLPFEFDTAYDAEKRFVSNGYSCLVRAVTTSFPYRCGYVALGMEHPAASMSMDELNANVDVHGGVTYLEQHGDMMVVGFDCLHGYDSPDYSIPHASELEPYDIFGNDGRVWTLEAAMGETQYLAQQLARMEALR